MDIKSKQLNSNIHPKLKEFILEKISSDLKSKDILPWKNELWILDIDTTEWYLTILSEGQTWYNQDFFKLYLNLFSLTQRELAAVLKEWIEKNLNIKLTNISRRQANMHYLVDGMLKSDKNKWELNNRFGFSYEFVKKVLEVKGKNQSLLLEELIPSL